MVTFTDRETDAKIMHGQIWYTNMQQKNVNYVKVGKPTLIVSVDYQSKKQIYSKR